MGPATPGPTRGRIAWQAIPQTLQEMERAAEERYEDGLALWLEGRHAAAVYLLGYAAEVSLKTAYFRWRRVPVSSVWQQLMHPSGRPSFRASVTGLGLGLDPEAMHSLRYWAELLIASRRNGGVALDADLERDLLRCVAWLYQNWWVEMRYLGIRLGSFDVEEVVRQIDWLNRNRARLWT